MSTVPEKIIVGIVASGDEGRYFSNGLHQNAWFLFKCLSHVPNITPLLVYWPEKGDETKEHKLVFGEKVYRIDLFYEQYQLDVLLLVSALLPIDVYDRLRTKNKVKMVSVAYGNRYVIDQEITCFGHLTNPHEGGRNFADQSLRRDDYTPDAVWVSPHFAWQKNYIGHRYGLEDSSKVHVCPYIWGPELIIKQYDADPFYEEHGPEFRKGNEKNKNIFCTEPSINTLKTSFFPFMIGNCLVKKGDENFGEILLFGSKDIRVQNKNLAEYFTSQEIAKQKKVFFEARYPFKTITKHAQVMLHHHFMNGLNYTMLECAALKIPVVHNSEFMKDFGYYYPRAEVDMAVDQCSRALMHEHRDDLDEYNRICEETVYKFFHSNPHNVWGHQTLIANLFSPKVKPELPDYIKNLEEDLAHADGHLSPLA